MCFLMFLVHYWFLGIIDTILSFYSETIVSFGLWIASFDSRYDTLTYIQLLTTISFENMIIYFYSYLLLHTYYLFISTRLIRPLHQRQLVRSTKWVQTYFGVNLTHLWPRTTINLIIFLLENNWLSATFSYWYLMLSKYSTYQPNFTLNLSDMDGES